MKSFLQVGLPILILMTVVGVVAYVTQNTSKLPEIGGGGDSSKPPPPAISGEPLTFENEVDLKALPTEKAQPIEMEYLSRGHKDFWFHTTQQHDVRVGLEYKSCTCTDVEMGDFALSTAEWEALNMYPSLGGYCRLLGSARFRPLIGGTDERLVVEGTPVGGTAKPYVLRLNWQAKKETPTPEPLIVRIIAQVGEGAAKVYTKEIAYLSVYPVALFPQKVDMGELTAGSNRSVECVVWSMTRDHLKFKARLSGNRGVDSEESCVDFSAATPLTPQELEEMPRRISPEGAKVHLRCGYRFTITLHERRGENQLDLGPFNRQLTLSFITDKDEPIIENLPAHVNGLVRGDLRVLNGDDRDRIALGSFKYDRGKSFVVRLAALDPKLELVVDKTSDPKLKVNLAAAKTVDGRKEWEMTVTVEPNAFLGELPPSTMIQLQIKSPNPRRVRIPVTGRADR